MSQFERLIATADADTWEMVRRMVPKRKLALFMAKTIAASIGANVDIDEVARIFGITKHSAYNRIAKVDPLK
jgi:hypothetical protein